MAELIIARGVPGSGKSTAAKEFQKAKYTIVNRDSIRFAMYGLYYGGHIDEDAVTQVEDTMIDSALSNKRNVFLDATNLVHKQLRTKLSIASRYGATVSFMDFPISAAEAIVRDRKRGEAGERAVGQAVIEKFFKRFKIDANAGVLPKPPELWPYFEAYTIYNNQLPAAYIVDTDGTVANHENVRNPYDESKYHLDTVHEHVAEVVRALHETTTIIGLSGRDEAYRDVTLDWWEEHEIPVDYFFMRPHNDKRVDAVIKYELFKKHIEPKFFVLGAFDDRPQVLRMWRTIGVPVFDVGYGLEF